MNEVSAKKKFLMRVTIGIILLIILILWSFNLKNVWNDERSQGKPSAEWAGLKSDLEKTLNEAQAKLNKLNADKAQADKEKSDSFLTGLRESVGKKASSSVLTATSSVLIASSSPLIASSSLEIASSSPQKTASSTLIVY